MKTIYKYQVLAQERFAIQLPALANILTVQSQHGEAYIWAVVDTEEPLEHREFALYGTGHRIPDEIVDQLDYIGTVQSANGSLVFHLFEILDD